MSAGVDILSRTHLTAMQHAVVVGSLLGDGSMRCKSNALLEVNHSSAQRSYVDWKYGVLRELVTTPPKLRLGNGGRTAYRFVTRSLPVLTPYYRSFYPAGRKVIPEIGLDALALAIWVMDDGSRSRSAMYLNTQQFSLADQELAIRMLAKQFGIVATLNRDKSYHRLRIAVESMPGMRSLVSRYVLPELAYKLPTEDQSRFELA